MPCRSSIRKSFTSASSMAFAGNGVAAATNQKVEIGALVRLHHALDIEALISAGHLRLRRRPSRPSARKFTVIYVEMQPAALDVEFDPVTFFDKRQRAADRR